MTNEQILEKQVEALEKLLQLRTAIIEELEAKINKLEMDKVNYPYANPYIPPTVNVPWINPILPGTTYPQPTSCPIGPNFTHEYPMWNGTSHPACKKCNQFPTTWITSTVSCNASEEGNGSAGSTNVFALSAAPAKR